MAEEVALFTVKELFLEIRQEIKGLRNHVDEQGRIEKEKLDTVDRRLSALEVHTATTEAVEKSEKTVRKLILAVGISILGMIANVLVAYFKH